MLEHIALTCPRAQRRGEEAEVKVPILLSATCVV